MGISHYSCNGHAIKGNNNLTNPHFLCITITLDLQVLIVQIRPSTKVICSRPLNGNPLSPPCLGWHFVSISSQHHGRSVDPVLAFGRHDELHFVQLRLDVERRKVRSYPLLHFQLDFKLRCLQWLDSRTLALLDSQNRVRSAITFFC